MAVAAGGKAARLGLVIGTPSAVSHPAPNRLDRASAQTGDVAAEASFLHAWEQRLLAFPTTAEYITRVRQIRRAQSLTLSGAMELSKTIQHNATS